MKISSHIKKFGSHNHSDAMFIFKEFKADNCSSNKSNKSSLTLKKTFDGVFGLHFTAKTVPSTDRATANSEGCCSNVTTTENDTTLLPTSC